MTISHIVCTNCDAINRLETQRMANKPKCGKCKQTLFQGRPADLNDQTFSKHISKNDIPVVVDFWAAWCGPCKMMAPEFQQAAIQIEPEVRFAKLDTEKNQQTATQFNVRSIPTMILFKNGKEIARQAGAMSAAQISQWIHTNK